MTRRRYPGLAGRTAVITGAARGVGALLARRLADQGVRTALVGLEPDELAATAKDCGAESDWWQADVTDAAALEAAAAAITERHGRVDAFVERGEAHGQVADERAGSLLVACADDRTDVPHSAPAPSSSSK